MLVMLSFLKNAVNKWEFIKENDLVFGKVITDAGESTNLQLGQIVSAKAEMKTQCLKEMMPNY